MREEMVSAFDGTAEYIVPLKVLTDADEAPEVLYRDAPLENAEALTDYEKTILALTLSDLREAPTFDGERIYSARGHFYASKAAKRLENKV
ncbi:MAG: hypothetical protein IJ174_03215 [Clostridia bacterium]|nr:hypothetical protein [Clostridia bacterium]